MSFFPHFSSIERSTNTLSLEKRFQLTVYIAYNCKNVLMREFEGKRRELVNTEEI